MKPKHILEQNHTPEPWQVKGDDGNFMADHPWSVENENSCSFEYAPIHYNEEVIALVVADHDRDDDIPSIEANARRIVACVNACAGIPSHELEQANYVHAYRKVLKDALTQRDELLAALVEYGQHHHNCGTRNTRFGGIKCDCGLAAAIALVECGAV